MVSAVPIFGSVALILYWPDSVSSWMYSPRLSVLVVSLRLTPPWNSTVITTPTIGLPSLSTTLPLTIVDWAKAAGASARRNVNTSVAARVTEVCVMCGACLSFRV